MPIASPLPEQLRPNEMSLFLGQELIVSRLKTLMASGHCPSLLFFGPPGCGKSTLALLMASASGKRFIRMSAPESGLQSLRRQLADVDLLILDELHRFSKAQQDFFLPLVESGELTLMATTTENPSFSITRQLLSRMHVFKLNPLSHENLIVLAQRGTEKLNISLDQDSLEMLATAANGDGRSLLNLVAYAASLPENQRKYAELRGLLPEMIARHDKNGDSHYELASAMIKSIRGSDPDAALYYAACLIEGGEDPRFVCRRLILSASEDIGLADPSALRLAVACQQAVEFVGMPEGFIPIAETVVYLALACKSNSAYAAYLKAKREIKTNGMLPVPFHLRNPSTILQKEWGYGKGYKYPHNFPDAWVEQQYMPDLLNGVSFYQPGKNGEEPAVSRWWRERTRVRGDRM